MKITRREIIRLSAGAGVAAFGGLSPILAGQQAMLTTRIPSSGLQVPAVGLGTVRFRGNPGSRKCRQWDWVPYVSVVIRVLRKCKGMVKPWPSSTAWADVCWTHHRITAIQRMYWAA